jgi:hypothetical protein
VKSPKSQKSATKPRSPESSHAGTRRREQRPERIDITSDVLIRNDVMAAMLGGSIRGLNREDANGAPYIHIHGVKYRPQRGYHDYLASKVKRRGEPPKRRGASH